MTLHRLNDAFIEKARRRADTDEIDKLAIKLLEKAGDGEDIEALLSHLLFLAFRCGYKTAIG